MDFILNGQPTGDVAQVLMQHNFDPGALRPFKGSDGRSYVTLVKRNLDGTPMLHNEATINAWAKQKGLQLNEERVQQLVGTSMVHNVLANTQATLRKDEWIQLDRAVREQARPRLKAFQDLRTIGSLTIPNGMGKTILEYQNQTDITPATVSMDGLKEGLTDRSEFDLRGLPLPITHKDFQFSARQLATSRNDGTPFDTTNAGLAGRKVAEEIERATLGLSNQMPAYGGYRVFGYKDFPQRLTLVLTAPTDPDWTPRTLVQEVLQMKKLSQDANHRGPWKLYCSSDWDPYMDDDYSEQKGSNTLRQRLADIKDITEPETLDYLDGFDLILVQQTPDVARAVVAMDITTLQWPSHGGMQQNFKVMGIMVPQIRSDAINQTGIVHAAPAP